MIKMKILPLLVIYLFLTVKPVFADYSTTLHSYIGLTDYYRTTYQSYQVSKNKYLTYGTLTSQKEAMENGRNFLKARDQLVMLYLQLLNDRINEGGGFDSQQKDLYLSQLNVEWNWLSNHRSSYDSISTLIDLQRSSDQMQERYNTVVRYIALKTAGVILTNKAYITTTSLNDILQRLTEQMKIISQTGADLTIAERWLIEAGNKTNYATLKQSDAMTIFVNFHGENIVSEYNKGLNLLTESNQYLREANSYLSEILRIIKGE